MTTTVTLTDVLRAASTRAAVLTPETAGYLVLAGIDAVSRAPGQLSLSSLALREDGSVAAAIGAGGEVECEDALRKILERLLFVSVGRSNSLFAATARPTAGLDGLARELESALIPMNRAAGRRALARLHRETQRAVAGGRLAEPTGPLPGSVPALRLAYAEPPVASDGGADAGLGIRPDWERGVREPEVVTIAAEQRPAAEPIVIDAPLVLVRCADLRHEPAGVARGPIELVGADATPCFGTAVTALSRTPSARAVIEAPLEPDAPRDESAALAEPDALPMPEAVDESTFPEASGFAEEGHTFQWFGGMPEVGPAQMAPTPVADDSTAFLEPVAGFADDSTAFVEPVAGACPDLLESVPTSDAPAEPAPRDLHTVPAASPDEEPDIDDELAVPIVWVDEASASEVLEGGTSKAAPERIHAWDDDLPSESGWDVIEAAVVEQPEPLPIVEVGWDEALARARFRMPLPRAEADDHDACAVAPVEAEPAAAVADGPESSERPEEATPEREHGEPDAAEDTPAEGADEAAHADAATQAEEGTADGVGSDSDRDQAPSECLDLAPEVPMELDTEAEVESQSSDTIDPDDVHGFELGLEVEVGVAPRRSAEEEAELDAEPAAQTAPEPEGAPESRLEPEPSAEPEPPVAPQDAGALEAESSEPPVVIPEPPPKPRARPRYAPRRSDVDALLAGFSLAGARTERELARDLKRMAGLEPTAAPPAVAVDPAPNDEH